MESNKDQMVIMHTLCWKEIECLKRNLDKFIEDSERCQKLLRGIKSSEEVPNIFSLFVFDRYMTQMVKVLNLTRKYNIHLEINNLDHTVINASSNGCLEDTNFTQTRLLKDFVEWRNNNLENEIIYNGEVNTRAERIKMTEHTSESNKDYVANSEKARIKFLEKSNSRELTKNQHLKKPNEILGNKVDDLLNVLLPIKNLDHFKNNYEFQAYIVHVSDYNKLEFFICQIEDYKILYDLSINLNFKPISRDSLAPDDVFCVLENRETNTRECLWRAVCVPPNGTVEPHKLVYLLDIGETIPLLDQCEAYEAPLRYRDIAPLAIRCVLEGVEDSKIKCITKDQDVCKRVLHTVEFKNVTFRAICKKDQVLHVVMLETPKITENGPPTNEKTNPFLNTEAFENDEQNSSANSESLQLPRSAVYHKSPIMDPVLNIYSEIGDKIQIIVTHIISPISFYGIIQNDYFADNKTFSWHDHQIDAIQKQMSTPPQINDVVLSQYVKDNYWYRARVVDIYPDNDLYKVFYVDFGNTEVVHLSNLAKCSEAQLKDPLRAVLFHLSNLSIVSDEQDILPSAKTRFKSAIENIVVMILDQILNVEVIERRKDNLVVRFIDSQYVDIPKMLVDKGVVVEI